MKPLFLFRDQQIRHSLLNHFHSKPHIYPHQPSNFCLLLYLPNRIDVCPYCQNMVLATSKRVLPDYRVYFKVDNCKKV